MTETVTSDQQKRFENGRIYVTHVTVRESLFILVAKLILIEFIVSSLFVVGCQAFGCINSISTGILATGGAITKFAFTLYVLIQWLTDYYEITPKGITHLRGLIFQTHQEQIFSHVTSAGIQQGVIGRIFNFGTIRIFNKETKDYYYMYQIHNPYKYFNLINTINPTLDENTQTIREHIVEKEKQF